DPPTDGPVSFLPLLTTKCHRFRSVTIARGMNFRGGDITLRMRPDVDDYSQLLSSGLPSAYPAAVCSPTTARSWNSVRSAAPTYVHELRTPETIESSRSSTLGRSGSRYIRAVEMPSSKMALRARWKAESSAVRDRTARADAIPKLS